jgi:uncharacterized membrane protein YedE/YeeE
MKGWGIISSVLLGAVIFGLGYWFASGRPLDHEFVYLALLAGFIICDRSFWPRRFR